MKCKEILVSQNQVHLQTQYQLVIKESNEELHEKLFQEHGVMDKTELTDLLMLDITTMKFSKK